MKNQNGFTLLSMMLAVSALGAAAFMLTLIMTSVEKGSNPLKANSKEVYTFFHQVTSEIHQSSSLDCKHNKLYLDKDSDRVSYQQSRQRVFRQVEGKGYDIVLQQVSNIKFFCKKDRVTIIVKDLNGKENHWAASLVIHTRKKP
ncbi:competence protein ComGF [Scopulibacillus daqui]|uniref:Competence protein ComGF n=1 Tax=Scopulibacillus daqui TaxID=1469162 RepID=A0ABS2Q224_9BACL|nr:competence type IV pilus minor pilin ComGF [Scopulibacillus daqui]MBM7646351.1 competence protein ComGF [Scopulibacillus daqui]